MKKSNVVVKTEVQSLDEILLEARQLISEAGKAETELYFYLNWIETTKADLLKGNGITNFSMFLRSYQLAPVRTYQDFAAGLKVIGAESARKIGIEATSLARKIKGSFQVKKYVTEIIGWMKAHGNFQPSTQVSQTILKKVSPPDITTPERRASTQALQQQIEQLLRENADLRAQNAVLMKERDSLLRKITKK
jgi:hypothetical protein